jgi:hypothetical protein
MTFNNATIEALKIVSNIFHIIGDFFEIENDYFKNITITDDDEHGLVFSVTLSCYVLGSQSFSSDDFELFCKQHSFNGLVFFNRDGTVTFSMYVKKEVQPTQVEDESYPVPEGLTSKEWGYCLEVPPNKIEAIKAFRDRTGTLLAEAKQQIEQHMYNQGLIGGVNHNIPTNVVLGY